MVGPRVSAAMREFVHRRAHAACEYCGYPDAAAFTAFEIDHVVADQHGGLTEPDNLALACLPCNRLKGPNLASIDPVTGALARLFHPRQDHWAEHFDLLPNGQIQGRTLIGRATAQLLCFNAELRVQERQVLIEVGMLTPAPTQS